MQTTKTKVIFCDFDGTITQTDNVIELLEHFQPAGSEHIARQLTSGTLSIKEATNQIFALIPSALKDEITQFILNKAKIRPGFSEFITFCRENAHDLYITSGGFDFIINPLIQPFNIPSHKIYCNLSDFSQKYIRILWPHPCDDPCKQDCGMCKTTIMRRFSNENFERIVIGDSFTDFESAKLADTVFARSHLIDKCEELRISYCPLETFHDIMLAL